jgi:hypothetical protein
MGKPNKYTPHQGKKEMARRVKQAAKKSAKLAARKGE